MLKVLPDLVRLQSHKSVAQLVNGLLQDERLRQVFSFHPLLVGGNPFPEHVDLRADPHARAAWGVGSRWGARVRS
jgi:phytoene desaturase